MLEINFTPFPEMETDRLVLRQFKIEDGPDFFVLRSDPNVMQYIPRPLAKTVADAVEVIELVNKNIGNNESINWALEDKATGKMIGMIGYVHMSKEDHRAEVGYMLHPEYHGKGYMQEALTAVLDYGFIVMKLHSVNAVVDPANTPSAKLLEKNKFTKEGYIRENCFWNGVFLDSLYYSLLAREW